MVNAVQALVEYGYTKDTDGVFRQPRRGGQSWKQTAGGYLRYDYVDGADQPTPFTLRDEFNGVSGLTHTKNPDCYVWVWPEEEIDKIYTVAKVGRDERLAERMAAKAQMVASSVVVIDEPVTEAQIERMVESQETEVESKKRRWWNR